MRVALIVDAYHPFRSSAAIQIRDLAQEFVSQGHEVIVIAPAAGQKESWTDEFANGVRVLRLSAPKTKNIGRIRRTVAEVLLPFFMIWNFRKSPVASLQLDGIVWYSPTIFFGPLVHMLKLSNQCGSYLILRDLFPEFAVDIGILKRGLIYRFFKAVESYQYSLANAIGVQSQSNMSYLYEWSQKPARHLEVLNNWLAVAPNIGSVISVAATPLAGKTVIVYAGNMGVMQGIDIVLDLAERLMAREDVGILMVGRGSEVPRLKDEATKRGLKNIVFHNEIDPSEVPSLLKQCDIGLLLLDPRHKTHNIPGKLLSYMQAGLPILARINLGNDLENLITDNDIGFVHVGETCEPFFAMAESLIDDDARREIMANNCRTKVVDLFSPTVACKKIISALN